MSEAPVTHYPDTGPLAVLARLGFGLTLLAIFLASIAPGWLTPQLLHSHHLEHFAAFYVAACAGLAAMPRTPIRRIAMGYLVFAMILALIQYARGMPSDMALRNWVADAGGVLAALSPVVVERFRRLFAPRPS
ncbi:MAG: hypothetical protein KAX56_15130 [Phenylobacterium sp.]|nr:hypothetical protein [Phenylobacterium sp.]